MPNVLTYPTYQKFWRVPHAPLVLRVLLAKNFGVLNVSKMLASHMTPMCPI